MDVLLERGVAGRVVLHVVGGAQTFAGVEGNVGGLAGGLAARGALVLCAAQQRGAVGQCLVVVPGGGQQQLGQLLIAQHIEDESRPEPAWKPRRSHRGCGAGVSSACVAGRRISAYPASTCLELLPQSNRSEKHGARKPRKRLRYTLRIVWKLPAESQSTVPAPGLVPARLAGSVRRAGPGRRAGAAAVDAASSSLRSTGIRWSTATWPRTCCCTADMLSPLPAGALHPTLIRLPGYPLFLALCFRLFGMENYASAAWVQIALELAGCLLLADFARRIAPPRSSAAPRLARCGWPRFALSRRLREPADRIADAVCAGAGAVVGGALPGSAGMGAGALVHLCGHLRGAVAARWRAGGRGFCACTRNRAKPLVKEYLKHSRLSTNIESDLSPFDEDAIIEALVKTSGVPGKMLMLLHEVVETACDSAVNRIDKAFVQNTFLQKEKMESDLIDEDRPVTQSKTDLMGN